MGEEVTLSKSPDEFAYDSGVISSETLGVAKEKLNQAYEQIIELLRYYVDMKEENYHIVALWIIGTYFHKQFSTYPILFINAMRGSGKTRLLKIISHLQYQGDGSVQNNISEAVLFRLARVRGIILDEIESLGNKDKGTLRELLNACYKKGARVQRMKKVKTKEGEEQIAESFELYTPVAMANIWGIEEVLQDRAITITLEKSGRDDVTKILEAFDKDDRFLDIKRTLTKVSVVWCRVVTEKNIYKGIETTWNDYIKGKYTEITSLSTLTTLTTQTTLTTLKITQLEHEELFNKIDNKNINGRNLELIFPLLMVSLEVDVDKKLFDKVLNILAELVEERKTEELNESKDVSLYKFVSGQEKYRFEWVELKSLTRLFREYLGDSDEEERWLNDKWMGRALKRLCLIVDKKRLNNGRQVILNIDKAREKAKLFSNGDKDENV